MKSIAITLLLVTCFAVQRAEAASYGCSESEKELINHNAQDPTRPGTIGGCGLGQFKYGQFEQQQRAQLDRDILIGPTRTHGLGPVMTGDSW